MTTTDHDPKTTPGTLSTRRHNAREYPHLYGIIRDLDPAHEECGRWRDGAWSVTTDGTTWTIDFHERGDLGERLKFTETHKGGDRAAAIVLALPGLEP